MTDLLKLGEIPGLSAALCWLMKLSLDETKQSIFEEALNAEVLSFENGGYWHADTDKLDELFQRQEASLPSGLEEKALLLCGLGELAAHSHAEFFDGLLVRLKEQNASNQVEGLLDAALKTIRQSEKRVSDEVLSVLKFFSTTALDWDGVDLAVSYVLYHEGHFNHPNYGFAFVVRLAIHLNPKCLANWAHRHLEKSCLAIVLGKVLDEIQWQRNRDFAEAFIQGDNPFLRCIGCAALVTRNWWTGDRQNTLVENFRVLTKFGVGDKDAIWISSFVLKEALHAWHRSKDAVDHSENRLDNLKGQPQGEERHIGEIEQLEYSLVESRSKHEANSGFIENSLSELAQIWPSSGLSEEQLIYLRKCFVKPLEISYRLAQKLKQIKNSHWLLDKNIDEVVEYLGVNKPDWAENYFYYERSRDDDRLQWGAKSYALRWQDEPKKIVFRLGGEVENFTKDAESLIQEPFCHVRKPTAWASATERLAATHLLVLWTIETVDDKNRDEVQEMFFMHVPRHVTHLLKCAGEHWNERGLHIRDQLIQTFIWFSKSAGALHLARDNWINNPRIPVFARAMALWSAPFGKLLMREKALEFFERLGQIPMGDGLNNPRFNEFINLLDIALLRAVEDQDEPLAIQIVSVWEACMSEWEAKFKEKYLSLASTIQKALFEDGPERIHFLSESSFTQSYCAQYLKARNLVVT